MAEFSEMKTLELWYEVMGADELVANIKDPDFRQRALRRLQKEKGRTVADDIFPKLVERNGDIPLIKDQARCSSWIRRGGNPSCIASVEVLTAQVQPELLPGLRMVTSMVLPPMAVWQTDASAVGVEWCSSLPPNDYGKSSNLSH